MRIRHRSQQCLLGLLFLLSLGLTLAGAVGAAPAHRSEYRVTVVGPPGSVAVDINQSGVVVGNYPASAVATHGFLNRGRGLVDLGTLGGTNSYVEGINDRGQVIGNSDGPDGNNHGFIYHRGVVTDLGFVPGTITRFADINNAGYTVGSLFLVDSFDGPRGFERSPTGIYKDLGALVTEVPYTQAFAINNRRQIVGHSGPLVFPDQPLRAFIYSKGVMTDMGGLGWEPNAGLDINDCGQATGFASLPLGFRNRHAFLYSKGRLIDIDGRPDSPTAQAFSSGNGINSRGHVVGTSDHLSGFIYRGKAMQSLNTMIDPALGWDIVSPNAINNAGQIAATAMRAGVQYAVRLDPRRKLTEPLPLDAQVPEGASAPGAAGAPLDAHAAAQAKATAAAQARADAEAEAEAEARELAIPVQQ